MESVFYYPITLHRDKTVSSVLAILLQSFPVVAVSNEQIVIRPDTEGSYVQGVYSWEGLRWQMVLPYIDMCNAIIRGYSFDVYHTLNSPVTNLPQGAIIYRNGVKYSGTTLTKDANVVWAVLYGGVSGGGGPTPPAQGGVKTVNSQTPDAAGNVIIKALQNNAASGLSLIADSGASSGTMMFRNLVSGANITITQDANGNLLIASTGGSGGAVNSVNGETGDVVLTAVDVGAFPDDGIINNGVIG